MVDLSNLNGSNDFNVQRAVKSDQNGCSALSLVTLTASH
jgi:hypothetical protein